MSLENNTEYAQRLYKKFKEQYKVNMPITNKLRLNSKRKVKRFIVDSKKSVRYDYEEEK